MKITPDLRRRVSRNRFFRSNNLIPSILMLVALGYFQHQMQSVTISFDARQPERERVEAAASEAEAAAEAQAAAQEIARNRKQRVLAQRVLAPVGQSMAEATVARSAITRREYEIRSGYCSRFARQVVETTHGTRYSHLFGASATESANLFRRYGYALPRGSSIEPGDLLFKVYDQSGRRVAGGYGHVGIYVGNNLVAENSSTSLGRISGAKGYRTLSQYGYFDVVGRLPLPAEKATPKPLPTATPKPEAPKPEAPKPEAPKPEAPKPEAPKPEAPKPLPAPRLILVKPALPADIYVPVVSAQYDSSRDTFTVNQSQLASMFGRAGATVRRPLRDALGTLGIGATAYGNHLDDKRDARLYAFIGRS
jgi:hypothetical protein